MLRRTPSLALRAGLIFVSIYTIIFLAFLAIAMIANFAEPDEDRYDGPSLALSAAAGELRHARDSYVLPGNGYFAQLAARNPSLWLIGHQGERTFSFGPVPDSATKLFADFRGLVDTARFRIPDAEPSQSLAAMRNYDLGTETLVLAAGGIDPASLTAQDSFREFGSEVVLTVFAAIAVLGLLAMLIALPSFSRALRPITTEAAALDPDGSGRLDEQKAPRELLPLVRSFNDVLNRLSAELGRRKRFISDVAHELRTPLAVVTLRVESLEDQDAREDLRRATSRLTNLVAQMLDLERLSLAGRERVRLDLTAIARGVVGDLAPTGIRAGYDLSLEAPEGPVIVTGDEHAVARAIGNLVANSIAHGGGAGDIQVIVGRDRTLDVVDEGPGIPPSLQPRLFDPFCRDTSHSEGCGLGLHLTREIMRAHGGDIRLLPTQRGAAFRLEFPQPIDE